MSDNDHNQNDMRGGTSNRSPRPRVSKTGQWTIWAIFFFPMMILANGAMKTWGFLPVMLLLLVMLGASLLAARYISRRSWHSILWGDRD